MKFKAFFNLIRWKNLVLIAIMQLFIKRYFLSDFETILSDTLFYFLIFTTLIITASGYIINDIIDVKTDLINKPTNLIVSREISFSTAKKIYFLLTFLGVLIGVFISFKIDKPLFSLYFVMISVLLYVYSIFLKGKILIGNIVVSSLLAFSILILLLFDVPIQLNTTQLSLYSEIREILITYAILAFLLNFIREIIKDIEDINGDYNSNLKTFPIIFGRKIARNFAMILSFCTLLFFLLVVFKFLTIRSIAFGYTLIFIFFPLLYFTYKLWNAKDKKQYRFLSILLKIIIFLGIISIPII